MFQIRDTGVQLQNYLGFAGKLQEYCRFCRFPARLLNCVKGLFVSRIPDLSVSIARQYR